MGTLLPFVGMVIVILAQVSTAVVTKAAMSRGVNKYVIIVYSNVLSTLVLLPCSYVFHRSVRLPLSSSILWRFFLLALVGCVSQICGYAGIDYSSPTLSTAMLNLTPAFTFILTVTFRMEKLDWRSRSSQAKTLGTLISIAGAFVATFYKGPAVIGTQSITISAHLLVFSPQFKWVLGAFLLATEALMMSAWYILQTMILKKFPAILTVIFYLSFFTTIISAVYSLILVEDTSAWKLRLDIGLIAVLHSALVGTVLRCTLCAWCISKAGPLYVSMFKPLGIIFAVVMGVLFLGDALCVGSMVGAIIIVTGFYAVMWGKANEEEKSREESGLGTSTLSSEKVPLLQNRIEEKNSSV
ncbi:hypothetical protein SLEP1_g32653 [Rubroshorea leprosula]|uniref:WAT1-related protein n=1 Tax=Rubroshorea leprosula TaxID=152421 RepID=A0AAV5KE78_9ROSI|nr:hypothetical protein SLEP1_g32653 [Rubroshorea leprosula]